jgi:hypothetical protein
MKTLKITFLLLVLSLPLVGTYVVFKHYQYKIRKEVKRKIKKGVDEKDLILLKIPKKLEETSNHEFTRIHSKEFRFKGEMYDIVRQIEYADTTYYWCIWDREETALFAQLDENFNKIWNSNPVKQNTSELALNFLKSFYYQEDNTLIQTRFWEIEKIKNIAALINYQKPFLNIIIAPPEC